eukprot:1499165-Heterocapsa_arctica.AAC.1
MSVAGMITETGDLGSRELAIPEGLPASAISLSIFLMTQVITVALAGGSRAWEVHQCQFPRGGSRNK